jgi:hypothetical protein
MVCFFSFFYSRACAWAEGPLKAVNDLCDLSDVWNEVRCHYCSLLLRADLPACQMFSGPAGKI